MDLVLVTRNLEKIRQILPILTGLPLCLKQLNETQVSGDAVENMPTIEGNALKKAVYAWKRLPPGSAWCVSDDSGLYIDALQGAPGHHAARWAGKDARAERVLTYTLEMTKDILPDRRGAVFRTAAVLLDPSGRPKTFYGEIRGTLLREPRGAPTEGMPYGPIFQPAGKTRTWSEMTVDEINGISHRAIAFRAVRDYLLMHVR